MIDNLWMVLDNQELFVNTNVFSVVLLEYPAAPQTQT
jgi:hypothetical protein